MKKLGKYRLGDDMVRVYTHAGQQTWLNHVKKKICIGLGETDYWWEVVNRISHEAIEYLMAIAGYRYEQTGIYDLNMGRYIMHCDHGQFQEVMARFGYFAAAVLPDLSKAYNKHIKKGKKT